MSARHLKNIPTPPTLPVLGNILAIDTEHPVQGLMKLAEELGPIFRMKFPGRDFFVVSSARLVDELCDETRFRKLVHGPLIHLKPMAGNGLFTAETSDPTWGKAHRVLMPAFGPNAMRDYFDGMLDIADQLIVKWARKGERCDHDVASEMTQLTLDTIALCGFGYRFNSFYQNEMPPFIDAMVRALAESGDRSQQLPLQTKLKVAAQRQFESDIAFMNGVVDEVIRERKSGRTKGSRDLLALMLEGKDPVTGEGLDDVNIRYQMVTFLIAGHETTSGLLSFALYELLRHPEVLSRARAEVDAVLGGDRPRFEHLARLGYLDQVLRETLRLWPTAPAFAVTPLAKTRLGDVLDVGPGDDLLVLIPALHRDDAVWGSDAGAFKPDRFAPGRRETIPVNAWKPFGSGVRACIGRPFALQEATLVLAMLLQRFELSARPDYELVVKETLTLKPEGFTLRVKERAPLAARSAPVAALRTVTPPPTRAAGHGTPLTVLFGSNTGSSEAFARRIAGDAEQRGYAVKVAPMDDAVERLPTSGALVVVTASYNGRPPDNAARFCEWLDGLTPGALKGLPYTVFGCGHRDWVSTFQAVPTRVDAALERAGGKRLMARGEADARGDFFGDFEGWYPAMWPTVDGALGVTATASHEALYEVKTLAEGAPQTAKAQGFVTATVVENRELVDLTSPLGRSKRHVVMRFPEGVRWECGDYLSVWPENPPELVARALRRFGLEGDAVLQLSTTRPSAAALPIDRPVTARELLSSHVELAQPATKRQVEQLVALTRCPPERAKLEALVADYRAQVLDQRRSVLDLLEDAPACALGFAGFLEQLPPLKPRLYSIASSPLVDPAQCALLVSVLDAPAWSGRGRHRGVGSSFLARAAPGQPLQVAIKQPNTPFRLPEQSRALLLIAAGAGLAPFRGFLEERAARKAAGEETGRALLYFGCDHRDVDFVYRDELARWEAAGVVEVRPTFCKAPEGERVFVQHRLWEERDEVRALIQGGAKVLLCGDGARLAPAVREVLGRILPMPGALAALEQSGRFVADVFS